MVNVGGEKFKRASCVVSRIARVIATCAWGTKYTAHFFCESSVFYSAAKPTKKRKLTCFLAGTVVSPPDVNGRDERIFFLATKVRSTADPSCFRSPRFDRQPQAFVRTLCSDTRSNTPLAEPVDATIARSAGLADFCCRRRGYHRPTRYHTSNVSW